MKLMKMMEKNKYWIKSQNLKSWLDYQKKKDWKKQNRIQKPMNKNILYKRL